MNFDILYLDNHLLVVVKPAGLLSQADATGDSDLPAQAKAYLKQQFKRPGNVYLGLVHRLDRPVSGVMVLARTSKAAARLSEQFRRGAVTKEYLALVEGCCAGEGMCVDYVTREDQRTLISGPDAPGARRAELSWRALARSETLSLVAVTLKTGRPHQIRAQLAHRGLPILGDRRYGAAGEFDGRNLALHCFLLQFSHPITQAACKHTAAPPPAWRGYFDDIIASLFAGA